ncbi:MAG: DNA primase [Gammaproteobacteria bacterium]|nr:DNA primase [Gammaproteobacteria bacterium]
MAGLIPQAFIDDLLNRVDIVDVVDKRVKLRKTGKNYSGLCPFHQEKSPSFSVEPDKQFYYCFGCGDGGNAIGFLMHYDNLDFPQAVENLAAEYGIDVPRETVSKADQKRQSRNSLLLELLDKANHYYQLQLRQHSNRQQAVDYLKARGLSGTVARDFMLGYAPPGWDNLLGSLGNTDEQRTLLLDAGLLIEKEREKEKDQENDKGAPASDKDSSKEKDSRHYYDRFRDRIMFPIRNSKGQVIGFGGRVLGDDKPKYLNSPETPVFHKSLELYGLYEARQANRKLERVIIVEGYMDVIALAQSGINNAVATLGTATNANHLKRLFRLVNEVVFCFDGDEAGRTAAWRALQASVPLMEDGRDINFLFLPEGEDPDSLVRKIGKEKFIERLDQAVPLADFFFDKLSAELDLENIGDRAALGKLARPLISQFPKGIYGQLMVKRLAELVGMDKEQLDSLIDSNQHDPSAAEPDSMPDHVRDWQQRGSQKKQPGRTPPIRGKKSWSLKAIELILAKPEIALEIDQDLNALAAADGANSRMLLELIELVRSNPNITTYAMLGYFYDSPVGNRLTQLMREEKITPSEGIRDEFREIIDRILSGIHQQESIDQTLKALRDRLGKDRPSK